MQASMILYSYRTIFNYSSTVFQSKFTRVIVRLLCSVVAHRLPHVKTCSSCNKNKTYNWSKYLWISFFEIIITENQSKGNANLGAVRRRQNKALSSSNNPPSSRLYLSVSRSCDKSDFEFADVQRLLAYFKTYFYNILC